MTILHCPHCGEQIGDEQIEPEFKRPSGCICDPYEWRDPYNIPAVCDKFDNPSNEGHCRRCEHDYLCHVSKKGR